MGKIKLGTYVTAPRGKIITGRYAEHKGDGPIVHTVPKSKHHLDLRGARSKALHAKKEGKRTNTHNHHGNRWGSPEAIADFKREFGGPKKSK